MPSQDYKMPIYLQLREIMRNKIEDGEYMPGTAIPSENKLSESFGINRITIRNAVDALVNEGLLRRVQGKGVFVVGNKTQALWVIQSERIPEFQLRNYKSLKDRPEINMRIYLV